MVVAALTAQISVILGSLLAAGTWIIRGTLFLNNGGIIQNFGSTQEILFLEVALTENWLIFITRTGGGGDFTLRASAVPVRD